MIVGRERLNARQMIGTMCGARDGLRMVMKDTFSSVILIEGNAQEECGWWVREREEGVVVTGVAS